MISRRTRIKAFFDAKQGSRGQILPLFALFIIVLFGMAALATDVSRAYADLRFYRATADAASLAGAQDLQVVNSRMVTVVEQEKARTDALNSLVQRLGGNASGCGPATADIGPCILTGTPYEVTIKTPSPSCSSCDPVRSVQVTVRHPDYGLTFARVLGSAEWDVGTTSVAGLEFGKSYAIITLRPQKKLGSTFDIKDIQIGGGTVVTVDQGDVGSNANMNYSGSGSLLVLDPDYDMYYTPGSPPQLPQWGLNPVGKPLANLIKDPNYRYPFMTGSLGTAPAFDDARASKYDTLPAVERADTDSACAAEALLVDPTRYAFMATQPLDTIYCYEPGVYESGSSPKDAKITIGTGDVGLLKPGAYYLKSGLHVGGRIIGGYEPGSPGVALMFDEAPGSSPPCPSCIFNGNNALTIALNAGTRFPPSFGGGTAATAAIDWDNQLVETSGPAGPTPPLLITLLVIKDPDCYVPTVPPDPNLNEPAACVANKNTTINIQGNGSIALEGVQYAPTDNVKIAGDSGRRAVGRP